MKWVVGALAVAAGSCEFFGTYTVWQSYRKTSLAARSIIEAVTNDQHVEDSFFRGPGNLLADDLDWKRYSEKDRADRRRNRGNLIELAKPLVPSRITALELAAYFVGAILGIIATLLAL